MKRTRYIKTEWVNNVTIVDANNLNNMENAIENLQNSSESYEIKLNRKIDSVIKESNKLVFLSEGAKISEVDLSSITSNTPGPQGPVGPQGPAGENGTTPNIQIGNVMTVPSNQQATISRRGTDENPIFDFSIPKGADGLKGEKGERGERGLNGADGLTTSVSIGSTRYTHQDGNITLPDFSTARSIGIADSNDLFTATNVEDALTELRNELGNSKTTLLNNINSIKEVL
jgi:hypothetical protein